MQSNADGNQNHAKQCKAKQYFASQDCTPLKQKCTKNEPTGLAPVVVMVYKKLALP